MFIPVTLFLFSLATAFAGYVLTGAVDSPLVLLAGLSALAALWIVLRAALGQGRDLVARSRRQNPSPPRKTPCRQGPRSPDRDARAIVVDGSNVMHWGGEIASLDPVAEVVAALSAQGYRPGVIFDANAGYKLTGRYLDDAPLAAALGLPSDRVLVVPRGTPADPVILESARQLDAPVVSNDRFRDWLDDFPELADPQKIWRGGYANGALWLGAGRPSESAA